MEYTGFGSSGIKVSRLALGLGFRGQENESEAKRVIEHALDRGINFIDCANAYGPMDDRANAGRSEIILGKALRGKRDHVVITSKVGLEVGPGFDDRGLSRFQIFHQVERSLKRLHTDHIDVYLAHVFDDSTPLEETLGAFDDLVRAGKVRCVGCCNFAASQVSRALRIANSKKSTHLVCVQNQYNLLNRTLEREMFGLLRDQRLGFMAYGPLAVGLLSGVYFPEQPPPAGSLWARNEDWQFAEKMNGAEGAAVSILTELAAELGKTPAQLALAWVLSHPEVTVAITGSDTTAQLEENLGAVGWTLDERSKERLDSVSAAFVESTSVD